MDVPQSSYDRILLMAAAELVRHDEAWCMRQFWIMADAYLEESELVELNSKQLSEAQILELYHAQLVEWVAWALVGGKNVVIVPG